MRRTAVLVILVCSVSLTAHWAFIFWYQQHLRNLPDVIGLSATPARTRSPALANALVMSAAILGNFLAAAMARVMGYRRAIALLCLAYFLSMVVTYSVPRSHTVLLMLASGHGCAAAGCLLCSRCTCRRCSRFCCGRPEPGFCYNIGRIAAAVGTVVFGLFTKVGDYRIALICAGCLFLPAAIIAWWLPELSDRDELKPSCSEGTTTLAD